MELLFVIFQAVIQAAWQWVFPGPVLKVRHSAECSATGTGQFLICKLKWDLLRTSVTACTIDKSTFSAQFGIFYVRTAKEIFQKSPIQTPNGILSICKLPFPHGNYCNDTLQSGRLGCNRIYRPRPKYQKRIKSEALAEDF